MTTQSGLYRRIQTDYDFSDLEMQQMKYTLSVLNYELTKFILLGIVASIFGLFAEYAAAMLVLLPIRIFSGGIHFNHYSSCLLFTGLFFAVPILLRDVAVPYGVQLFALLVCLFITYLTGPVTAEKRRPITYEKYCRFRLISSGLVLMWFLIFAIVKVFPYQNICFWMITLQSIQLLCAKFARKGEIYEKVK